MRLLPLLLAGCATRSPATAAPLSHHVDESHSDDATACLGARLADDRQILDDDDATLGDAREIRWSGPLGPGVDGVIAWFGACGNWGECVQGVLARCPDGRLLALTDVDYFYELEIGAPQNGWVTVVVRSRGENRHDPPTQNVMHFDPVTWRYR